MANLVEKSEWEDGIYQLEITDPLQGGPDGIDNVQARQLGNRTRYLKDGIENETRERAERDGELEAAIQGIGNMGKRAGTFDTFAGLPVNVSELAPKVPTVNDFANVRADETQGGATTRYVIDAIAVDGTITWGFDIVYSMDLTGLEAKVGDLSRLVSAGGNGPPRDLRLVFGIGSTDPAVYIPLIMAEIRRRCNNNGEIDASGIPDFSGLMIGDYIDGIDLSAIPAENGGDAGQPWNDTYKNNRIVISGFNTFHSMGTSDNIRNHVLFMFRNVPLRRRMNATNTNTGGYVASEMRAFLEGTNGNGTGDMAGVTTAAFLNAVRAQLGNFLLTITKLHSTKGSTNFLNYTLFLPSELEVFGSPFFGDEGVEMPALTSPVRDRRVGDLTPVHFPIFAHSYEYRIKRRNGARHWWWTQTPFAGGSASFSIVTSNGIVYTNAASGLGGCAPAFCVA